MARSRWREGFDRRFGYAERKKMVTGSPIVFHFVLPQDVAVLRPLIFLAKSLPGKHLELLVSKGLTGLGAGAEIEKIGAELNLPITFCDSGEDAARQLEGKSGLLIVGHESSVKPYHAWTHDLFMSVGDSFLKVTLQHGFECVGFLHNAAHEAAHGHDIRFAADVVVGWFAESRLTSMHPAERTKLYVAGPPIMIEARPPGKRTGTTQPAKGIICENLHSVRFTAPAVHENFLAEFSAFAERAGVDLDFRPHPAGQFTDRMGFRLPPGVVRNGRPLYEQDLTAFDFAISPPSSILFDFVIAKVPTAVWIDAEGRMDHANFAGLETVSSAEEWWSFAERSIQERDDILANQERFLEKLQIPLDVAGRYAALMSRP
jgi:hypothetical protein